MFLAHRVEIWLGSIIANSISEGEGDILCESDPKSVGSPSSVHVRDISRGERDSGGGA